MHDLIKIIKISKKNSSKLYPENTNIEKYQNPILKIKRNLIATQMITTWTFITFIMCAGLLANR